MTRVIRMTYWVTGMTVIMGITRKTGITRMMR